MSAILVKNCLNAEKQEATRRWLESQETPNCELEDDESIAESSVIESSDGGFDSDTETDIDESTISTQALGTTNAPSEITTLTKSFQDMLNTVNSVNSVQNVGNVNISNSTNVHIGNITNINGNIQIIHASDSNKRQRGKKRQPRKASVVEEHEERVGRDAFMEHQKFKIPKNVCNIVQRHTWLAQLPMEEYEYMHEPVQYVVISHTATESSDKQAINIRIIRDIQCFHIESREWNDIAYNFLVGCDGNIYEGRGWGVVGAHTKGYNTRAIGISFIGCFMREEAAPAALNACRNLLQIGVQKSHIAADYRLICHCQCRPTQSPGRRLFEEIQKWEHFYRIEDDQEEL